MTGVRLGRNRMLAIALDDGGNVLAFGSARGNSYEEAEDVFAEAVAAKLGGFRSAFSVYVEQSPQWKRIARRITFADIGRTWFIINA